jgi:hypothetical protein
MKLPISDRLLACAGFVCKGDRVADVGCDHGYLSIYLLTNGIAKSCIASDINEQMKMAAAMAIAGLISDEELNEDYIIPAAFDPRVGPAVAKAVAEAARASGVARI